MAVVLCQLVSLLVELMIGDENVLCHCVRKWRVLATPVTIMVATCCVIGCTNRSDRSKDISFYSIPTVVKHQGA